MKCNICDKKVKFLEHRGQKQVKCPICGSLKRHRLAYYYLSGITGRRNILHYSPHKSLKDKLIKKHNYWSVDIKPGETIMSPAEDLPLMEDTYDIVISLHVLEHVKDLDKSLDEMVRVMGKKAIAIIQVPFEYEITQPDHVRTFDHNILINKLIKYGKVKVITSREIKESYIYNFNGYNNNLYILEINKNEKK